MTRVDRICLFPPGLDGGGVERVFVNLAAGFVALGFEVDLLLVRKEGPLLNQIQPGTNVVSLNARRMLTSLPALCRYLRKERPDVVLTGLSPTHTMASLAKFVTGAGTRLYASIHSTHPFGQEPNLKLRVQRRMEFASYGSAEKIITVSHGVLNELVQERVVRAEKCAVVYNPVLTEDFGALLRQPVDHPFFASGGPPIVVAMGRLTKVKDFGTLINAFALAVKETPLRLIILGEGEDRRALEELVRRQDLVSDVSLPGFVENPYPYLRASKLFVLSSLWEGFGNVLVEAMASGCPIVSTDCPGGPAEILGYGKYGRLVPVGDHVQMANAILESLNRPGVAEVPSTWLDQFTLKSVAEKYLEIFGSRTTEERSMISRPGKSYE